MLFHAKMQPGTASALFLPVKLPFFSDILLPQGAINSITAKFSPLFNNNLTK